MQDVVREQLEQAIKRPMSPTSYGVAYVPPGIISSMRRTTAVSLVLLALAAGGATIALAGSDSVTTPITRAQANAFAHAVELRARDLPGAKSLKGAIFGPEAVQYEALKCGLQGRPGIDPAGGAESWLVNSRGTFGSVVVVAPSDYLAERELGGLESQGGLTCLARALGRALSFERDHQPEWSHTVRVTFAPIGERVSGVHLSIHVVAQLPPVEGVKLEARYISVDAAFFAVGPADIAFFAIGAARFSAATEAQVLALLHSRADAHKL
jgi:hypothetical protein